MPSPVKNSRPLPIIVKPRVGPIALIAPEFPHKCPICSKPRTGIVGGSIDDKGCNFACGGSYAVISDLLHGSTSQEKPDSRKWGGFCGQK